MPPQVNHLKQCDIFQELTPAQLVLVANLCREATFSKGEVVFMESSRGKELYVIAQGEVEILVKRAVSGESKKSETLLARLSRGQSFGEIALVDEGVRSATARASEEDTRLLVVSREKLIMLCETYPELGYRLMFNLAADLAMKIRTTGLRNREGLMYAARDRE